MTLKKAVLAVDGNGNVIQGSLFPVSTTLINYYSTQSGATGRNASPIIAEIVRLLSTTDCFIGVGDYDVAVTSSTGMPLSGGAPEYITLKGKQYIAVIRSSQDGVLRVTIME